MINSINGLPPIMNKISESDIKQLFKTEVENQSSVHSSLQKVNNQAELATNANSAKKPSESLENKVDNSKVDYTKLAETINREFGNEKSRLEFTLDEESEQMILKIIDSETNEVVRQLPPEITLKIAKIVAQILEEKGQVTNARV